MLRLTINKRLAGGGNTKSELNECYLIIFFVKYALDCVYKRDNEPIFKENTISI